MRTKCNELLTMGAACLLALTGMAEDNRLIEDRLEPAEGWSPVGLAVLPVRNAEWPGPASDVGGLELALLASHNRELAGVGLATCGCWADGDMDGLVVAGLGTWSNGAKFGVHLSSIMNYAEGSVRGLQLATANSAYDVAGVQLGVVNCSSNASGFQCGLWNLTERGRGFQLGLVNMAMDYSGVQVGLGNIIGASPLTACLLVNAWF